MSSSTRISDLPDTISVSKSRNENSAMGSGTYIPIDVHENPITTATPARRHAFSQSTHLNNQQNAVRRRTPTRGRGLPRRTTTAQLERHGERRGIPAISASTATAAIPPPAKDMPSNTVEYMNDEQIHANYIPKKN
jgi:hypothetical protein